MVVKMNMTDKLSLTMNAIVLGLLYTFFGLLLSYIFYNIFDEYDEIWIDKTDAFKIADVTIEIGIIAIVGFWSSYYVVQMPALFPLRSDLNLLVNNSISGIFFLFGVFLFLDDLTEKIRYLHKKFLSNFLTDLFPRYGSIVDLSLSYKPPPRKTEAN